jgi:catechol 2,3-dioxygenase-like lactoylglutathione lyase family enzyme
MVKVKLTSIVVNDQRKARAFYTEILGFAIKHDIPIGDAAWLTLVAPDDRGGIELLLEPAGHPAAVSYQRALCDDGIPFTQLYTDDIHREYARLIARGVVFKKQPQSMGPTLYADFDDTCGNIIRLVQG